MGMLVHCGALAAGEFAASFVPHYAAIWPIAFAIAVLTMLFGYGLRCRGWSLLALALLGLALFWHATERDVGKYRATPWMRGRASAVRQSPGDARLRDIRHDLSRRLGIGLSHDRETAVLSRAILLGERTRLPARTKRLFVESGTMHVFAISGLHVLAIADVLTLLLALTLVPRRFTGALATPLLWGYVLLIGAPPSAVRAAAMATFSALAPLVWRKPDGLRSWSLTFLLVHLLDPLMIVNAGNALSFVVMMTIVLVGQYARDLPKWKQTLLVTFAAWAVGVPIAAHLFGRVTPGGLLANLVLIATARLTVYTGALGLIASYVSTPVAAHVNNLSALGIRAMVFTADGVSRLPGSNFETGNWPIHTCIEWYAALALTVCLIWLRRARRTL